MEVGYADVGRGVGEKAGEAECTGTLPLVGITLQAFTPFLSPLANPFSLLTLDNFREAFEFGRYRQSIFNSLFLAAIGGLIATLFMALCALVAYRSWFPFRGAVKYLALYPRAFPGTVIGLGFLWALLSVPAIGGLRNTLWVLVIAYSMRYLPLGFSSVSPSILQISDELDRAARLPGADPPGSWFPGSWRQGSEPPRSGPPGSWLPGRQELRNPELRRTSS